MSAATSRGHRARGPGRRRRGRGAAAGAARPADATRSRSGVSTGAPRSRLPGCAASTGCTTIRGSPSAAPANTVSSASSSGRVAAPVAGQRGVAVGGLGGVEVADDVGAAEGVDRLLRVADQDQRGVPVEGARAGSPTAPGRCPGTRRPAPPGSGPAAAAAAPARRVGEGVGKPGEHVVVGVDAPRPLAPRHLGPHRRGEAVPHLGGAARLGVARLEPRLPVVHRPAGERERLGAAERGRAGAARAVLAHVEVVDHLGDQVVDRLDEHRVAVAVAGHPEPGEHLLAELVGGGDGGRVEVGERAREPGAPAPRPRRRAPSASSAQHVVGAGAGRGRVGAGRARP